MIVYKIKSLNNFGHINRNILIFFFLFEKIIFILLKLAIKLTNFLFAIYFIVLIISLSILNSLLHLRISNLWYFLICQFIGFKKLSLILISMIYLNDIPRILNFKSFCFSQNTLDCCNIKLFICYLVSL